MSPVVHHQSPPQWPLRHSRPHVNHRSNKSIRVGRWELKCDPDSHPPTLAQWGKVCWFTNMISDTNGGACGSFKIQMTHRMKCFPYFYCHTWACVCVCAHTVEEGRVLYLISQLWVLTNHCTVPRSAFLSFLLSTLQPAHPLHRKQPHRIGHVMVVPPPENEREDECDNTSLLWTVVLQVLTIGRALAWFLMLQSSCVVWSLWVCVEPKSWFTIRQHRIICWAAREITWHDKRELGQLVIRVSVVFGALQHKSRCIKRNPSCDTHSPSWRMSG